MLVVGRDVGGGRDGGGDKLWCGGLEAPVVVSASS